MTSQINIKSSSRAGRFKKKLVSEDALKIEAPLIEARLTPYVDLYRKGQMTSTELTAAYIVLVASSRHPKLWLGAKTTSDFPKDELQFPLTSFLPFFEKNIQKRLENFKTLGDVFFYHSLKSTPLAVNRALLSWGKGDYPLELMFRIPTPAEVLEQQKFGKRCVSLLYKTAQASHYILNERDAMGFTMHDLIHADHFYHHNDCYQGQLGVYGFLDFCLNEQHFADHLKQEEFVREFEYLISDMNAYAIHIMKCLKSALMHYHEKGTEYFANWVQKITQDKDEQQSMLRLNHVDYTPETEDAIILRMLDRFKNPLFKLPVAE